LERYLKPSNCASQLFPSFVPKPASSNISRVCCASSSNSICNCRLHSNNCNTPCTDATTVFHRSVVHPSESESESDSKPSKPNRRGNNKPCNNLLTKNRKDKIRLLSLNCQSLHNKRTEFETLIEMHTPDIIAGTESWLDVNDPNSLYFPDCYEVFRRDRGSRGGGVFICVHKKLNATLSLVSQTSEILWADIVLERNKTLKLGVVYKPDQVLQPLDELIEYIVNLELDKNVSQFVAVCGDLNMPDANWTHPDLNSQCAKVLKIRKIKDHGFHQIVREATRITDHSANILDVVLTNQSENFQNLTVEDGIGDHKAILTDITVRCKIQRRPKRKIYLYGKARTESLKADLKSLLDNFTHDANSCNDIDVLFQKFKASVDTIVEKNIPTKIVNDSREPPWYNKQIRNLLKRTRKHHSTYKKSMSSSTYGVYSTSRRALHQAKKDAENTFLSNSLGTMLRESQKRFWSYVKYKTKGQYSSIPTLKSEQETLLTEPKDKANLLNKHFQSVFTKETPAELPTLPRKTNKTFSLNDITLTKGGIVNLIKQLNQYKAFGPDEISPKLLKLAPEEFSDILLILFNKCFELNQIPSLWKSANVTPVFKKGNRSSPENYRPISLTSILCKMLEHILTSNLATFLEENNLFCSDQFGFRKNRSCELQLHRVCQDLAFILDNKEEADLIFLDFSKAFDKVSHTLLLHKLNSYGLQIDIITLIKSFLSDRTQKVVIDGWSSDSVTVTSGVPQGSVLGPLLFLIYINDLPDKIRSKCRLFADDSLIYRKILTEEDRLILQHDLEEVADWCTKWLMSLNLNKCEYMKVSSKRITLDSEYKVMDHPLSQVSSYKYLGLTLTEKLNWNPHINSVISKANQVLYVTKRALSKSTPNVKETAYKSIVRPVLEYSASVWDPYQVGQINALEMIQRRAARFCLNRYQRMDSVSSMIDELQWDSLAARRKASRLSTFCRVFNNQDGLTDLNSHIVRAPQNLRNSHQFKVHSITCRQNYGHYSFIPRSIRDWNSLPADIASQKNICDPPNFRSLLLKNY
jgi:Reverse transcriptase (RNA-dependent DNA polymerase)/Endonuclease-reverse transcriptase